MAKQEKASTIISRTGRIFFHSLLCALVIPPAASAGSLVGRKAASYIGVLKRRLTGSEYYAVVLERRNEEHVTGNRVDAVIFSPLARTFRVIRRLDQDHALVFNVSEGQTAPRVTAENFSFYQELIAENAMQPEVIFDKDGSELLIAYCGLRPCRVIWRRTKDGRLNLEVRKFLLQEESDVFLPVPNEPAPQL